MRVLGVPRLKYASYVVSFDFSWVVFLQVATSGEDRLAQKRGQHLLYVYIILCNYTYLA